MGADRPVTAGARPALDLLVQGGTVITAARSFQADVGVLDGQIVSTRSVRFVPIVRPPRPPAWWNVGP